MKPTGHQFREARLALNLTQRKVAERSGLSVPTVERVERRAAQAVTGYKIKQLMAFYEMHGIRFGPASAAAQVKAFANDSLMTFHRAISFTVAAEAMALTGLTVPMIAAKLEIDGYVIQALHRGLAGMSEEEIQAWKARAMTAPEASSWSRRVREIIRLEGVTFLEVPRTEEIPCTNFGVHGMQVSTVTYRRLQTQAPAFVRQYVPQEIDDLDRVVLRPPAKAAA